MSEADRMFSKEPSDGVEFNFHATDQYEVLEALSGIKSNSVGVDDIPLRFLRFLFLGGLEFGDLFSKRP